MWELDSKNGWALKNWYLQTVVLEKTLESPLDCKEIHPVYPKGNQSWIFIGRTDAEAEAEASIFPNILAPVSQFFPSGGQSIGASASVSALPMNIQGLFPLGLIGWISLQFKRFSRVFSNTRVWKHQFVGFQLSLWSNSHIYTWLLENHSFHYMDLCWPQPQDQAKSRFLCPQIY